MRQATIKFLPLVNDTFCINDANYTNDAYYANYTISVAL